MSDSSFNPQDPRLTAYVLGELAEQDRVEIERQLAQCPQSKQAVEDLRQLTEQLTSELADEPVPSTGDTVRKAVLQAAPHSGANRKRSRRAWIAVAAVGIMAAGVSLMQFTQMDVEAPFISRLTESSTTDDDLDGWFFAHSGNTELRRELARGERDDRSSAMMTAMMMGEPRSSDSTADINAPAYQESGYRIGQPLADDGEGRNAGRGDDLDISKLSDGTLVGNGARPSARAPSDESLSSNGEPSFARYSGVTSGKKQLATDRYRHSDPGEIDANRRESLHEAEVPGLILGAKVDGVQRGGKPLVAGESSQPAPNSQAAGNQFDPLTGLPSSTSSGTDGGGVLIPPSAQSGEGGQAVNEALARLNKRRSVFPGLKSKKLLGMSERQQRNAAEKGGVVVQSTRGGGLVITGPEQATKEIEEIVARLSGRKGGFHGGTGLTGFSGQGASGFGQGGNGFGGQNNEQYAPIIENPFLSPINDPLSTFSIDVDTASYSNVRRFLSHGQLPPPNAVRIEELVNYFHYDYPQPVDGEPFSVQLEVGQCPWNVEHRLVRVGLKGREISREQRPPSNLVFLVDVSGSMRDNNKLPLVKAALQMLAEEMSEDDRISIVTYAGSAQLLLDSTLGTEQGRIQSAIAGLQAGGSTNGEGGIKLAYQRAVAHFIEDGSNRVILCTDGDFNVGVSDDHQLVGLITQKAQSGVFLSIFGFGMGNLKDAKLEQLADKGNGHYAYVDHLQEARKVFVEELAGTLYTIAKDVKFQIEFNPGRVGAYRLIGYENRMLAAQDFADDRKDAGEIGAGHALTALYEIVPADKVQWEQRGGATLKYQKPPQTVIDTDNNELLTLSLRYKQPTEKQSALREFPLKDRKQLNAMPSKDFEWASSVAIFGLLLRDSQFQGKASFDLATELALGARGGDESRRRQEYIEMVQAAKKLRSP